MNDNQNQNITPADPPLPPVNPSAPAPIPPTNKRQDIFHRLTIGPFTRRQKIARFFILLAAIAMIAGGIYGAKHDIKRIQNKAADTPSTSILASEYNGGTFSISPPSGWSRQTDLNDLVVTYFKRNSFEVVGVFKQVPNVTDSLDNFTAKYNVPFVDQESPWQVVTYGTTKIANVNSNYTEVTFSDSQVGKVHKITYWLIKNHVGWIIWGYSPESLWSQNKDVIKASLASFEPK